MSAPRPRNEALTVAAIGLELRHLAGGLDGTRPPVPVTVIADRLRKLAAALEAER